MSELKPLPHVLGMMPSNFTSFQFGAKLKELYPDVYERNKANNMGKWLKQHAINTPY